MTDVIALMIEKARAILNHSYSPYSNFSVGACIKTAEGELFSGTNIENASYGLTLCAEMSAIAEMINHGQKAIDSMVILAGNDELCPPCGACRQRIYEFSTPDATLYLCNQHGVLAQHRVSELLPHAFGPDALIEK